MNTDQIINNMRHAKPKLYTMAVAHATRAFMKKAGRAPDTIPEDYERAMIEAIVEGIVYTMVPLLAAALAEMQAAQTEVAPPVATPQQSAGRMETQVEADARAAADSLIADARGIHPTPGADPEASTAKPQPLLDPDESEPAKPRTAYDWSSEGEFDAAVERITGRRP